MHHGYIHIYLSVSTKISKNKMRVQHPYLLSVLQTRYIANLRSAIYVLLRLLKNYNEYIYNETRW